MTYIWAMTIVCAAWPLLLTECLFILLSPCWCLVLFSLLSYVIGDDSFESSWLCFLVSLLVNLILVLNCVLVTSHQVGSYSLSLGQGLRLHLWQVV